MYVAVYLMSIIYTACTARAATDSRIVMRYRVSGRLYKLRWVRYGQSTQSVVIASWRHCELKGIIFFIYYIDAC